MTDDERPDWLAPQAAAEMRHAFLQAELQGRDGIAAAQSAAWAWHPALPAPMLAQAVALILRARGKRP